MVQTKAYQAILESRCPKCRTGYMFAFPLSKIRKFTHMNKNCSECGFRFEVEPGFFIGAMYISYAITIAILIATGIVLQVLDMSNIYIFVSIVSAVMTLFLPFIFRYSRVLFLYWFGGVKFDPKYS